MTFKMCFKYILKGLFSTIWWRQSYLSTCIQYYIYYSLLKWLRICGVSELKLQQNIKHCVEMKPNITTEKVLSGTSAARLETSNLKKKHPCWGIISSSHLVAYCHDSHTPGVCANSLPRESPNYFFLSNLIAMIHVVLLLTLSVSSSLGVTEYKFLHIFGLPV